MKTVRSFPLALVVLIVLAPGILMTAQTAASKEPLEIVVAAYEALDKKTGFSATMLATNDSRKDTGTLFEVRVASADVYYSSLGSGADKFESVRVGRDQYTKEPGGKWTKSAEPATDSGDKAALIWSEFPREALKNVRALGNLDLNGAEMALYEFEIDEEVINRLVSERMGSKNVLPKSDLDHRVRIWIRPDGLPVKIEDVRRQSGSRGTIVSLKKVTNIKYDEKIVVEAPKI
jgi:hypothetical protein